MRIPNTTPNVRLTLLFFISPMPAARVISGNDRINPPVAPTTTFKPPLKPEKTGIPMAPIKI